MSLPVYIMEAVDNDAAQLGSTALRFLPEAHQADAECAELRSAQ
jgi:hypothetical protein